MNQYKWLPTTCAPECYPVKLMNGAFDFSTDEPPVFIPRGNVCNNGWGQIGLINLTETELFSLPSKFDLTWFSFTEDLFYKGRFEIPVEKAEQLFKQGFKHPDTDDQVTYEFLVTGMGPEGFVCLWAAGHGIVTELATFKADVVKIEWEKFNDANITRSEFREQQLNQLLTPDNLVWLEDNRERPGLWNKYHEKYSWAPMVLGNIQPVHIWFNTFNGEKEFIRLNDKSIFATQQRSLIKSIIYRWKDAGHKNFVSSVFFNEPEVMGIFRKYANFKANDEYKLQLELNTEDNTMRLFFTNNIFWYQFKNCTIKIFTEKSKDQNL
ncbi:MAG: DUF2931 family protein [Ferruginibacter sp.]